MYIDIVPNRTSAPAVLLRESIRRDGKIVKTTIANLSSLSPSQIEGIRLVLRGEPLVAATDAFDKVRDVQHGACEAVRIAMRRLGFDSLIDGRRSRERDLVVAMVASRILKPRSKLATSRVWDQLSIADDLEVAGASADELYAAMDWLAERQNRIEAKLAARHLRNGGLALYDLSSSYFEGETCPLAARGHSRDGKPGTLQVNYGLLTDERGCPVAVSVYKGNTGDSTTLLPQVVRLREEFGLTDVVIVGDRGMISQKQITAMRKLDGVAWITALRTERIKSLVESGAVQPGLFDERNLFELTHEAYPGERLVACRNPELAKRRAHTREELLSATEVELERVRRSVEAGRLRSAAKIGLRVGRIIGRYKMAKHFVLNILDDSFAYHRDAQRIEEESALDGLYVVRTSLDASRASAAQAVHNYKKLARVERAFRSIKTVDLKVRPIHHHLEGRVRAHILLCVLAYYVEWHMLEALQPVLFADEMTREEKALRDPVAPATRSDEALQKCKTKTLPDGSPAQSFHSLMESLGTIIRSTCRPRGASANATTFQVTTVPTAAQQRALDLLSAIQPYPVA